MLALTWAALVVGAPALGPKDDRAADRPPGGLWAVVRVEREGERWDDKGVWAGKAMRFTATACEFEARGRVGVTEPVAYFADRGARHMDFYPADPDRRRLAIWESDGTTLTLCEGPPGGPRPTAFAAPAKSGRVLWVLRRVPE